MIKILLLGLGAYLTAAGFDFRTPKQTFERQDTLISALDGRVTRIEIREGQTEDRWAIWFRITCLDRRQSQRDLQMAGLNCKQLLGDVQQAGQPRGTP